MLVDPHQAKELAASKNMNCRKLMNERPLQQAHAEELDAIGFPAS